MRKFTGLLLAAGLGVVLATAVGMAQEKSETAKSVSMRDAMVVQVKDAQRKLVDLAEAFPADKYTWRPSEGVRSTAETFLHVATSNYFFPSPMGVKPPEGVDLKTLEKSTTDKAEIVETLKGSFEFVLGAFEKIPESDYGKTVKLPFGEFTTLNTLMIVVTHGHEHLGQLIAYARSNGVVPPWTARQQAAQAEAKKKAEEKGEEEGGE